MRGPPNPVEGGPPAASSLRYQVRISGSPPGIHSITSGRAQSRSRRAGRWPRAAQPSAAAGVASSHGGPRPQTCRPAQLLSPSRMAAGRWNGLASQLTFRAPGRVARGMEAVPHHVLDVLRRVRRGASGIGGRARLAVRSASGIRRHGRSRSVWRARRASLSGRALRPRRRCSRRSSDSPTRSR